MLLKLRNSNLLSIVLGARGTFLICFILLSCYLLYSVLAYTFLIPTGNFFRRHTISFKRRILAHYNEHSLPL